MSEPPVPPEPDDQVPAQRGTAPSGPAAPPDRQGVVTSLAVVVAHRSVADALALVAGTTGSLTADIRLEYLVLDDHVDPGRRDLFESMQTVGNATRFVPRPEGGRAAELDALTTAAGSEFVVVCNGGVDMLKLLETALGVMWVRGADAAVLGATAPALQEGVAGLHPSRARPDVDDAAGRLAGYLGIGRTAPGEPVVVIRRWVARWLLSEIDRAVDPAEEFADRGRLLGFGMVELSATGDLLR